MTFPKPNTPLKIGLITVAASYFLFSLHEILTLSWIGEWNDMTGFIRSMIFYEDISATVGLIFRVVAAALALAITIKYVRGTLTKAALFKVLRVVLVFEAFYWISFFVTAAYNVLTLGLALSIGVNSFLTALFLSAVPSVVESAVLPAVLLVFAFKLAPSKPVRGMAKWGLIVGTMYVFVFWLLNSSMWLLTINGVGIQYVTSYPQNLVGFIATIAGLLALAVYMALFTKNALRTGTVKIRTIGAILCWLGLYYLWNYLAWILFGGDYLWNYYWPAWFLGHNLDLWMMSLPLLGLPLLFGETEKANFQG